MKVAVGILSYVVSKAAASASTEEQDKGAVSSESKRAGKDRSSRRGGVRNKAEVSSAAFEEAERIEAETVDAGVLDVGSTVACPADCGNIGACLAGTAGDDVDCIGEIYEACYPESLPDDADADTSKLIPCVACIDGAEGTPEEIAADECDYAGCIYDCYDPENPPTDEVYDACVEECAGGTEPGSKKVLSVLAQA